MPPSALDLGDELGVERDAALRHAVHGIRELLEIAGAGHMVHFDRPRELVTAIREFLVLSS